MGVKLYPNPGSHTVYIELEDEETCLQEVAVYDMGGACFAPLHILRCSSQISPQDYICSV